MDELFDPDLWCPLTDRERRDLLARDLLDALDGAPGVRDTRIEAERWTGRTTPGASGTWCAPAAARWRTAAAGAAAVATTASAHDPPERR